VVRCLLPVIYPLPRCMLCMWSSVVSVVVDRRMRAGAGAGARAGPPASGQHGRGRGPRAVGLLGWNVAVVSFLLISCHAATGQGQADHLAARLGPPSRAAADCRRRSVTGNPEPESHARLADSGCELAPQRTVPLRGPKDPKTALDLAPQNDRLASEAGDFRCARSTRKRVTNIGIASAEQRDWWCAVCAQQTQEQRSEGLREACQDVAQTLDGNPRVPVAGLVPPRRCLLAAGSRGLEPHRERAAWNWQNNWPRWGVN